MKYRSENRKCRPQVPERCSHADEQQQGKSLFAYSTHSSFTMNLRQKIQTILVLVLILFTFASYTEGGTAWLQWLTALTLLSFMFSFDLIFSNDSQFIFDPDAENWRRKTVR